MTHQSKYNENKRFIEAYAAYLDECTSLDDKIKLSGEIGRLSAQNKRIGQMSFEESKREVHQYQIQVNALL
jgi:hypothetical protein